MTSKLQKLISICKIIIVLKHDWHTNVLLFADLSFPDVRPLVWHGVEDVSADDEELGLGIHGVHHLHGTVAQLNLLKYRDLNHQVNL